jgi:CRP/FNR family cyclic AMP-dependent transcriptional regulator
MLTFSVFNNEPDVRPFSTGQVIFEQGQAGDFMYAVLEGEVEIKREDRIIETIPVGGVFGEMALVDQKPRSASAVGKTNGRIAAITPKRFQVLVSQNPHFALQMLQLMAGRVRQNLTS